MDTDRWRQIEDLYHAALERASGERTAFLDAACDGDQALRQEVESLLTYDERAQRFITSPPDTIAAELLAAGRRPSPVGSSLGHYQILSLLGKGGMGEVYRARDARLSREVAIKLLPATFSTDKDRLRRFEQEARAAGMLNHPNVLTIYDIGAASQEDGGAPYIVSELLTGETLRERLRREGLTLRRAIDYASQIARGLAAAHEKGIVHRDLKPENLFLTKDGRVKILDFGLAKLKPAPTYIDPNAATQSPGTASGVVMGTVGYMSPEQARAEEVDHRADIFAFGAILYEMLTGRRAFQGASAVEVMNAILKEEPPEISEATRGVPPALAPVIRHCLEKNQEDRFQSVADIAFCLDTIHATADREAATAEPARPRSMARRWMAIAAVGIVMAAAIIIWRIQRSDELWENPLANAHIERVTDFPGVETNPAISPDGKFIVFLSDHGGRFDAWVNQVGSGAFVNLTNGRFSQLPLDDLRIGGFTADATHVWLRVTQIDALGTDAFGKETQSIWLMPTVGGAPQPFLERAVHAAWSPDGQRIVYHGFNPGDPTFVIDRDGSNPKQIFIGKPGVHCHHHIWSPDGRYIYFVSGFPPNEMDVWRIRPDGGEPERMTHHNSKVGYPALIDNRTLIYSATAEDGSGFWLYAMDVERRIPHRVTFGMDQYESVSAAVGLDGRATRLVASVASPVGELWTIPISSQMVDESAVRRFPLPVTRAVAPRFGPQYVVFLSSKGGAQSLWKSQGGETIELWRSSDGGVIAPAAVSPDGRLICFSIRRQGRNGLYVMNADGANMRPLAASLDVRDAPSWSPDGKYIAVAADEGDGSRLFKVPVDGAAPVRLVDGLSRLPVWSPDGSLILYVALSQGQGYEVKAVTPEKRPLPLPELWVLRGGDRYRFLPRGRRLVAMLGDYFHQNFWIIDLDTGQRRQLTNLKPGYSIRSFDVSPDGRQILFDRVRQNSDIVLIDLARK
ncbi:MAG TPA: protein kinase [Blastocatellia bacterium]|jgi:serine/threonine protein kinase/Tol biopolymer transport system component|nr:protein kinase [Blastocatellia bacterium]